MARGRGRGHKGQRRHFTSPEELKEQQKDGWRPKKEGSDDESNDDKSGSEYDTDSDEAGKGKGVSALIQIENPNRIQKKANKNLTIDGAGGGGAGGAAAGSSAGGAEASTRDDTQQLSRREREEIEKQKAREAYNRLHAQGKTDQARADLARLAIIKQQREEAAKRRAEELKAKEVELKAKQTLTNKALGKK